MIRSSKPHTVLSQLLLPHLEPQSLRSQNDHGSRRTRRSWRNGHATCMQNGNVRSPTSNLSNCTYRKKTGFGTQKSKIHASSSAHGTSQALSHSSPPLLQSSSSASPTNGCEKYSARQTSKRHNASRRARRNLAMVQLTLRCSVSLLNSTFESHL